MSYKKIMVTTLLLTTLQGCGDPEEKVQGYIDNGKSLYEQEKYKKAALEFKNALQIDNKRSEAYYHLGLMNEVNKNWRPMFVNYSRTVELNPQHIAARLKLGTIFLASKQFEKALKQAEGILAVKANNTDALALKGKILLQQKKIEEADLLAVQALQLDSQHIEAVHLKASILSEKKEYEAALKTLNQVLATQPQALSLHLLKLYIHYQQKDLLAVEKSYLALIKQFPENLDFPQRLAQFYLKTDRKSEAEEILETSIQNNADNIKPKLAFLDYLAAQNPLIIETTIKKYLTIHPNSSEFHFRLAGFYIKNKNITEAKKLLVWVVENQTDTPEALKAKINLAKIALIEKDEPLMMQLVTEILAVDAGNLDAQILKAADEMVKGLYEQVISNLRGVLRDHPKSGEATVLLAQAYARNKSPELAMESFRKAIELSPENFKAVMPVVAQMIKSKDLERAEKTLLKALSYNPNHAGGLQVLAQIRLLRKDWKGTQNLADFISTRVAGKGYSKYLSGVISQGQGDCEEALDKYQEALIESPKLAIALKGIVSCYQSLKQYNQAITFLDEFSKKNPDNFYPTLLKSHLFIVDKKRDKAITTLKQAIQKYSKTPQLYEALASLYQNEKELNKAVEVYQDAVKILPNYLKFRLNLAFLYQEQQQYKQALDEYESILEKASKAEMVINNLASLLLDHFKSEANIKRALKLTQQFKDSKQAYFLDTYAWALLNSGKTREALDIFKNVVVKEPNVAVFKYHLAYAYYEMKDYITARNAVKKALLVGEQTGQFIEKGLAEKLLQELKVLIETEES